MGLSAMDYRNAGFTFTALDVGQGQCLIYTADGETSVVDCGGAQDESGELAARYLETSGVFRVDRLILTHLDADHCNGAAQLLSRIRVDTLYLPLTAIGEDGAMLRGIREAAREAGTQIKFVREDTEFLAKDGCITILGPDLRESGNNGGLCVLASHEKYDILITGDLSQNAEYRLCRAMTCRMSSCSSRDTTARLPRPAMRCCKEPARPVSSFPSARRILTVTRRRTRLRAFKIPARQFTGRMNWEPSSSGEEPMAKKQAAEVADSLRQFKQDLKNNTLGNFYIFCGEEAFLRDYYLAELTKKLSNGPAAEFNVHRFDAASIAPQALLDAVEAMPMMAERTLVRVDDVDLFKLPEGPREQYRGIFEDLPEYVCLVFVYDTVEYKPNGQMRKLSDTIKKRAQVVEFQKPSERELTTWIARHFRAEGKTISDKLAGYLIFLTGGGMTQLEGEIKKISSYASGEEIQRSDIDAVVTPVLNAQTFDISNAIAGGNFQLALTKLQELFAMQAEPIAILGAVGSQIRRLYYAKTLAACGKNQQTFMELTGNKSSYAANLTFTAARSVSQSFCEKAVELCLQADRDMKRSADEPERILEVLVAALSQEARRG
ncbi:MAG: DNA polymerase III subunit delta [Oscillospiraceae bacterium]